MSKIDVALYESARIDGATAWQEFRAITVPSLRYEIGVCVTVTIIAALAAFDIVYISTGGGPGLATMVPGLRDLPARLLLLVRSGSRRRSRSLLVILVLVMVLPIQRLTRDESRMIVGRREAWTGRLLLIVLMVVTLIPFLSLLTTALHPSNSVPPGLSWPADPQWGNFLEAFDQAHMAALAYLERPHRARGGAGSGDLRDDGRFRHRPPPHPRRRGCCSSCSCSG